MQRNSFRNRNLLFSNQSVILILQIETIAFHSLRPVLKLFNSVHLYMNINKPDLLQEGMLRVKLLQ